MESGSSTVVTTIPEMDTKIEIKEEPWWIETPSTEVKDNPEEVPISDSVVKSETKSTEAAQIQVVSVIPEVPHSEELKVQHESKTAADLPATQQHQSAAETDSHKDLMCRRSSSIGLQKRLTSRNRPGIESSVLQAYRESSENFISSLNKIANTMEEANKIRARNLKDKIERARFKGIDIDLKFKDTK